MNRLLKNVLTISLLCGLTSVTLSAISARSEQARSASKQLPLIPIFASAQDSPEFEGEFRNDTDHTADLMKLYGDLSIVLDGHAYNRRGLLFSGSSGIIAHGTVAFSFSVDEFIPKETKGKYSEKLQRWQWKSSLLSGRHTLTAKFGGKTYGPVTFVWKNEPLLTTEQ